MNMKDALAEQDMIKSASPATFNEKTQMSRTESNNSESSANQYPACLSIVVPVFNEESTLEEVVDKLLNVPCLLEIIIVDDSSTDGTGEVARSLSERHSQVRVVRHQKNSGKTAALKTGFAITS